MAYKRRRKRVAPKVPSLKKKLKRLALDKEKWVATTLEVSQLRNEILDGNGGTCELTGEEIKRPTLDHCHETGKVRGVISQHSNTYEGYLMKYFRKYVERNTSLTISEYLRSMAEYYDRDWKRGLHHRILSDYQIKLCRKTIPELEEILLKDYQQKACKEDDKAAMIDLIIEGYIKQLEKEIK